MIYFIFYLLFDNVLILKEKLVIDHLRLCRAYKKIFSVFLFMMEQAGYSLLVVKQIFLRKWCLTCALVTYLKSHNVDCKNTGSLNTRFFCFF